MNVYYGRKELRIAGKAWEVRYKLRRLAKHAKPGMTVAELLRAKSHPDPLMEPALQPASSDRLCTMLDQRSYPMA